MLVKGAPGGTQQPYPWHELLCNPGSWCLYLNLTCSMFDWFISCCSINKQLYFQNKKKSVVSFTMHFSHEFFSDVSIHYMIDIIMCIWYCSLTVVYFTLCVNCCREYKRTTRSQKAFSCSGAYFWNFIPSHIEAGCVICTFKKCTKLLLNLKENFLPN